MSTETITYKYEPQVGMRRKTEREFLEAVGRDLSQLGRLVEERSGEHARYPDLEALLRLARLEASRLANREADRIEAS